ncbi:MAG: hypothetical protein C4539_10975 [Ignavibacteriales bacterium]|nr:MAG: hypothetical protein C4539_10975 [Ignavibacteriales bacterium]
MKLQMLLLTVLLCRIVFSQENIFENKFTPKGFANIAFADTSKTTFHDTSLTMYNADVKTILLETFLSPFMGAMFSFPSVIYIGLKGWSGKVGEYDYLSLYLSYVLGTSTCVYMLADDFNPLTSFWGILTSGIIGAGIGTVIIEFNGEKDLNGWQSTAIVSLPILCEVVYVNLINPKPVLPSYQPQKYSSFNSKGISYRDIYNSSMLYQFEVFRLRF